MADAVQLHVVSPRRLLAAFGPYQCDLVLAALRLAAGRPLTVVELIDFVWGGDAAGGPVGAPDIIRLRIHQLRRQGHAIGTRHGRGYWLEKPDGRAA